jgi:hypothetical protein
LEEEMEPVEDTPAAPGTPPTREASPSRSEFGDVQTQVEATALIRELAQRQLDRAHDERAEPNTAVAGDNDLKRAFWLLLDTKNQRTLFLSLCKNRHFWPRIRSCVGSPPFSFLLPGDNDMLRAGGITSGRVNMSNQTSSISSASDIGKGHFVDDNDRAFRVIADDSKTEFVPHIKVRNASRVVLDVKLPKMKKVERLSIFKRSRGRDPSVTYPKPGERILLEPNERLGGPNITFVVKTVEAHNHSPVCRLYCSRV